MTKQGLAFVILTIDLGLIAGLASWFVVTLKREFWGPKTDA